jgi:hypothetical protein
MWYKTQLVFIILIRVLWNTLLSFWKRKPEVTVGLSFTIVRRTRAGLHFPEIANRFLILKWSFIENLLYFSDTKHLPEANEWWSEQNTTNGYWTVNFLAAKLEGSIVIPHPSTEPRARASLTHLPSHFRQNELQCHPPNLFYIFKVGLFQGVSLSIFCTYFMSSLF